MTLNNKSPKTIGLVAIVALVSIFLLSQLGLAAAASVSSPNSGQISFTTPVNLSNDGSAAVYPAVSNVGSYVYATWSEKTGGILFRVSSDGGTTWAPPLTSAAKKISTLSGTAEFPIMCSVGSAVYITWSQTVGSTGLQVFVASSTDNGNTFSVHQLSSGSPPNGWITPACAAASSNAYVTYASNQPTNTSRVASTSDYGAHWSTPVIYGHSLEDQVAAAGNYAYAYSNRALAVTSNAGASWRLAIYNRTLLGDEGQIAASGSNVYLSTQTKTTHGVVRGYFSNDYGQKFHDILNMTTTLYDSWEPMVGAYGSSAWISLIEYPGGSKAQIWVETTNDGGTSWSNPVSLSGSGHDVTYPETVATSDGQNVFVVWSQELSSGYWVLRVGYSSDGGSTWTSAPGINVSQNTKGEAGFQLDLATAAISAYGTHGFAVWQYMNGGSNQVYFSHS